MAASLPLGAVLAGGEGRRFGGGKGAAELAGIPLAERAARILEGSADPVVLVTDDRELGERLGRPRLADRRPGAGPLAGLEAALLEARALGRPGALVLACDMPLVPSRLLEALVWRAEGDDVVLPASSGPLGVEPLCGFYAVSSLAAVQDALDADRRSLEALLNRLAVRVVPLSGSGHPGDPSTVFLNVNTREELERARELLRAAGEG